MNPFGIDRLELSGGEVSETRFAKFFAPNVSMCVENSLGAWSLNDFDNALRRGIVPKKGIIISLLPTGLILK